MEQPQFPFGSGGRPELVTVDAAVPDAVIHIDREGRIVALNHHASAMLDLPVRHALGTPLTHSLNGPASGEDPAESILRTIHERPETSAEWSRPEHGDWIELRSFPSQRGATVIMRDVTERKQRESRLVFGAYHDPLTQLPNRRLLLDRMEQALARARRNSQKIAVLFLDLDNFKRVNDNYGHNAGDQLLIEVARRLRSVLREEDTATRLGGDEFIVLLPHVPDPSGAVEVAQRIIDSLHEDIVIDGNSITPATSIGIAMSSGPDDAAEGLLQRADAAMYQSKARGKNCYTVDA